jgi:riboflavin-specific deaminase-like protein
LTRLRRLFPEPGEIAPEEAVAGLAGRETLVLNMVASVDGRAALDGRSAPLSAPADRAVFHLLRAQADAVLVGAGTLRDERYGRLTKSDELRARREAAGLAAEPLAVVLTRSRDLPWDIPLFQDPAARVAIYTDAPGGEWPSVVAQVSEHSLTDPAEVLAHLRAHYGVRCVLGEGGPRLNAQLLAAGVVDELFLTLSPLLAGGEHPLTIVAGELPSARRLELRQVVEAESALLLRYGVTREDARK